MELSTARNANRGETRNLAVREADPASKYIAYLSKNALPADDNWLKNLIQPMEEDPTVAGTFSRHIPRPSASPSLVRQLTMMWQTWGTERLVKEMPDDPEVYERDKFFYIYFSFLPLGDERNSLWRLDHDPRIKNASYIFKDMKSN